MCVFTTHAPSRPPAAYAAHAHRNHSLSCMMFLSNVVQIDIPTLVYVGFQSVLVFITALHIIGKYKRKLSSPAAIWFIIIE